MHPIDSLFDWFLSATARGSLLILAVLLVHAALGRRLPAVWCHALWLPVLFVLGAPALPESPLSLENRWSSGALPAVAVKMEPVSPAAGEAVSSIVAAPAESSIDWSFVAGGIWFTGALVVWFTGWIACRRTLAAFRREAKIVGVDLQEEIREAAKTCALRRVPRVLLSAVEPGPAMTGLLRPLLLLPADFGQAFDREERRLILLHEFTHVKRGDLLLNAIAFVLQGLHWCNPLVWFAFLRLRADRELACDSAVLSMNREDARARYGHALLKVESTVAPVAWRLGFIGMVGLFGRGRILHSRVAAIAGHRRSHPLWNLVGPGMLLAMALAGATRAQNEPSVADDQKIVIETKARLEKIIIPQIEFRDVGLSDALAFLRAKAQEQDPEKKGVNLVYVPGSKTPEPRLTVSFKDIPLTEALKYFAELAVLDLEFSEAAVVFRDRSALSAPSAKTAPSPTEPPVGMSRDLASRLVLPKVEFKEASLTKILPFLQQKSLELDPAKKGLNLILNAPGDPSPEAIRISLRLRNVPLSEALRYVAELANLKLRYEDDAVVFFRDK